jgi:hypothetical protein
VLVSGFCGSGSGSDRVAEAGGVPTSSSSSSASSSAKSMSASSRWFTSSMAPSSRSSTSCAAGRSGGDGCAPSCCPPCAAEAVPPSPGSCDSSALAPHAHRGSAQRGFVDRRCPCKFVRLRHELPLWRRQLASPWMGIYSIYLARGDNICVRTHSSPAPPTAFLPPPNSFPRTPPSTPAFDPWMLLREPRPSLSHWRATTGPSPPADARI